MADTSLLGTLRAKLPELNGLDDEHAAQLVRNVYYPDLAQEDINKRLGVTIAPPPVKPAGLMRTAGDMAIKAGQGVIDLGQSVVGVADLATGGLAGKGMKAVGYEPERAKEILGEGLSESQRGADAAVASATGFVDTLVELARNPRSAVGAVAQSAPGMFAIGGVQAQIAKTIALRAAAPLGGLGTEAGAAAARAAVQDAAGRLTWYGAAGEGIQQAGSLAGQAEQKGISYSDYVGPAMASGTIDALITRGAAKLMGGSASTGAFTGVGGIEGNLAKRVGKSILEEGVLQEMPQSAQEQVFQNIAEGKPWDEGVAASAAQGLVVGSLQGGGLAIKGNRNRQSGEIPTPTGNAGTPAPAAPGVPQGLAVMAAEHARAAESFQNIGAAQDTDQALAAFAGTRVPVVDHAGQTPLIDAQQSAADQANADAAIAAAVGIVDPNAAPSQLTSPVGTEAPQPLMPVLPAPAAAPATPGISFTPLPADPPTVGTVPLVDDEAGGLLPPNPIRQREADRPPVPSGAVLPGDIVSSTGKPFKSMGNAMTALANAGEGHEIVRVAAGVVVRRVAEQPTGEVAPPAVAGIPATEPPPLPRDLAGAKPRYSYGEKKFELQFDSDLDRAAFVIAQPNASKRDTDYLAHVMSATGLNEADARAYGAQVRDGIKTMAKDAEPGTLQVPKFERQAQTVDDAAHQAAPSPLNPTPEPTQAQKEAGNYAKGHVSIGGLNVSVENPQGSTRSGVDKDGKSWSNTLQDHYGYVKGTVGADGEQVDVFVKQGTAPDFDGQVFVVDQNHDNGVGPFDEHKAMIGYDSAGDAMAAYQRNYHADHRGGVAITPMAWDEFKAWAKDPARAKRKAAPESADAMLGLSDALAYLRARGLTEDQADAITDKPTRVVESTQMGIKVPMSRYSLDSLKTAADAGAAPAPAPAGGKLQQARDNSPAVQFARASREAGLEMSGLDPLDWSVNVGARGEVHASMQPARAGKPAIYSIRSMQDGKVFASLTTASFADVASAVKEQRAELLASEARGDGPNSGAPQSSREQAAAPAAGSTNTIFTADAAAKAREILRKKLGGTLNSGIDPEVLQAGITLAGYHIEAGARSFGAYVKAMVADLGDGVRPYLKSWYMGVKYDPRAAGMDGIDSAATVEGFDVTAPIVEAPAPAPAAPAPADPDPQDRNGMRAADRLRRDVDAAAAELAGQIANDMLDGQYATPADRAEIRQGLQLIADERKVPVDELRQAVLKRIQADERLSKRQTNQLVHAMDPTKAPKGATPGESNVRSPSQGNENGGRQGQPADNGTAEQRPVGADDGRGAAAGTPAGPAGRDVAATDGAQAGQQRDGGDAEAERGGAEAVNLSAGLALDFDEPEGRDGWSRIGYIQGDDGVSYPVDHRDVLVRDIAGGLSASRQIRIYDENSVRHMAAWRWTSVGADAGPLSGLRIDVAAFHYVMSDATDAAFGRDASDGDALWDRYGRGIKAALTRGSAAGGNGGAATTEGGPQLIEHVTGKGKALRGIVRMDLEEAGAKAIDPATFKKNGGYFIREKYLTESVDVEPAQPAPAPAASLTGHMLQAIEAGDMPKDNLALDKLAATFGEGVTRKQAQEALEAAIVVFSRKVVAEGAPVRETFDMLLALYQSQPNLNVRTSTSIANQAYSTPAPLAYLAGRLAGVDATTTMLEPTGGTGMLTIGAKVGNVRMNELDPARVALLQEQGFRVTSLDAAENMPAGKPVDIVVTNPPFGPLKDANDKAAPVLIDGYRISNIDHLIAARALAEMKDDGGATLIIAANMLPGEQSLGDKIFFNWLYSHYAVTSHFEVEGKLYARQGASWPVRVITIGGRQASDRIAPAPATIQRATTWEEVYEFSRQGMAAERPAAAPGTGSERAGAGTVPNGNAPGGVPAAPGAAPAGAGGRQPDGGKGGPSNVGGVGAGPVGNLTELPAQPVGGSDRERARDEPTPEGPQAPGGGDGPAREPVAPRDPGSALSSEENQFQARYIPRSSRKDEGVLIPVNMRDPLQGALDALEYRVGQIDEFVTRELGYASVADTQRALMGLQIDSVASAIDQIKAGKGVIIADQTGIGKGRQAAAIIRWTHRQGLIPVFMTVKPQLFTDMFGDLRDIGTTDIAPLILNVDQVIVGEGGKSLFGNKAGQHGATLRSIAETQSLPAGRNAVFLTYSQINVDNKQRAALMAIADRAVFILDEAHNAGGDSATGDFVKGALAVARGVTYLSATYAKRPDNMPVYFKTDIGQATEDDETLMAAMAAGGLPLQTVVSSSLVKAGQMFRRERSYDGVSIETKIDTRNSALHEKLSDEATKSLRAIVSADRLFHAVYFKELQKAMAKEGGGAIDNAGNGASNSVNHTEFSSVVHNFVKQLLLGLKADTAADEAIAKIKAGEKPLIAVENTMGSFLAAYAESNNLRDGDSLGTFDYRNVLSRALERSRVVTIRDDRGVETKKNVSMAELARVAPEVHEVYVKAQGVIDAMNIGPVPLSPIDHIRQRLTDAGYTVGEITGRNLTVDYSDRKNPRLSTLSTQEQKNKVETTRKFNDGRLDAIVLNVAGSTGISLHASEKFKDQRPRHMIVAQAAGDINVFMQMLGRIHRTGQVVLPGYSLLNVDLPAEKRPTAVLSAKMKSLNANTSSNTESATSVKALDMLNKYGDGVIASYLTDNPGLALNLGVAGRLGEGGEGSEDLARTVTGRMALMPVKAQREFYDEVETMYQATIDYLNKTNQNDLEPRTFDFDARQTSEARLFEGANPASPFGQDATYNEFSVKAQGKPMTPGELRIVIAEHLTDGAAPQQHVDGLVAKLEQPYRDFEARIAALGLPPVSRDPGRQFMLDHAIGRAFRVDINGDQFNAVVTNIRNTHKTGGNPYAMSKIQVTVAVNGALRSVTVPASAFKNIEVSSYGQVYLGQQRTSPYSIDQLFRPGQVEERETAKIVTGNLLGAYGELAKAGSSGKIISFTKADGSVDQGILLPKSFNFAKDLKQNYRFKTGADALNYLLSSTHENIDKFGIGTLDGVVRVVPSGNGITIRVPSSKARGGKFFLDKALLAQTGDFASAGSFMAARVNDQAAAARALDVLMKKQALYTAESMAEDARQVLNDPKEPGGEIPITSPGFVVDNPDLQATERAVIPPSEPNQNGRTAAEWLVQNGSEGWIKDIAAKLAPLLGNTTIGYLQAGRRYEGVPSEAAKLLRGGAFGVSSSDPSTGMSRIYVNHDGRGPAQVDLLHELVHAAADVAIEAPQNAHLRAELAAIREALGARLSALMADGQESVEQRRNAAFFDSVIDNDHELLAYGMSSPTFRAWASTVDATGAPLDLGKPSMWQRFVDAVRGLIGLSRLYSNRMGELLQNERQRRATFMSGDNPSLQTRLDAAFDRILSAAGDQTGDHHIGGAIVSPGTATRVMQGVRGFDATEARNAWSDITTSYGKQGGLLNAFQTQYHKARANPVTFGRVFDKVQDYITDTSQFATTAADKAKTILPPLETWHDAVKEVSPKAIAKRVADIKAAAAPIFGGTLNFARDEGGDLVDVDDARAAAALMTSQDKAQALLRTRFASETEIKQWQGSPLDIYDAAVANRYEQSFLTPGVVFTDAELQSEFGIGPGRVREVYREFLASVNQSLDDLGRTELGKIAGKEAAPVIQEAMAAPDFATAARLIQEFATREQQAAQARDDATGAAAYFGLFNRVADKVKQMSRLKERGYAPLSRFGKHTVAVYEPGDTERKSPVFFGMYESNTDANAMARDLKGDPDLDGYEVARGLLSQEQFELYQGLNLDAVEMFAEATGQTENEAYQDFIKLARSNRSILKRLIKRKGIAGFSQDVPRVLANFVTGNARAASANLHLQQARVLAAEIPKENGDIKDEAVKLIKYATNPQEEAGAIRALMFANFIGGSVASAAINLTQPFTMTLPFLTQYGGVGKATGHLMAAMRTVAKGRFTPDLQAAMAHAKDVVSPQEIHHLQGEAMSSMGRNPYLRKAAFIWGAMFSTAEQFNRRVTFVAAYNAAREQNMPDPAMFARRAVIETQGLYNKGNKPNVARGAVGATVMTFKQFSINYLEFLGRMARSGPEGRKAVGVALAILVLTAGTSGLPFAGDLEDLIDTLAQMMGYDFSSRRARRAFIADTLGLGDEIAGGVDRGLSGLTGMPLDVSLRMGMGNLIPGTDILLKSNTDKTRSFGELFGAAGGMAVSGFNALGQVVPGVLNLDGSQVGAGALKFAPIAVQNAIKGMQMLETGEYRSGAGKKVMDVDAMDAAMKAIGFQPNSVATQQVALNDVMRSKSLAQVVMKEIVSKWAQGLNDNDPEAVRAARDQLRDWNEKNETDMKFNMQSVINQVRAMRENPQQRLLRSVPAAARADYRERLSP